MDEMITFGIYKKLNKEESQKDKENFNELKKRLLAGLLYQIYRISDIKNLPKEDISQIDILIQKELYPNEIKRKNNYTPINFYLYEFGVKVYERLNDNEKMELYTMTHTYENCKNYVLDCFNRYIEIIKKECPLQVWKCFNEKCFIAYILSEQSWKAINKINTLIELIKDYFNFR